MSTETIDLTTALPPSPPEFDVAVRNSLAEFASRPGFGAELRKNRVGGNTRDRAGAVAWLSPRLGPQLDVERVTVTNGTQSALLLLLQAIAGNGGVIAAEALTYVVLRTIAARVGVKIVGVELDEEGIVPAHFERICRTQQPRALYCNPTVHNPTAAVMSEHRRHEVIEVARRHGVVLIEDDVLGAIHPDAPPPIAALAPDITWYVMSLSKCYAMGLRLAYLVAPSAAAALDLIKPVNRLSWWFPNSLCVEMATQWALGTSGRSVAAAIRNEADARQRIAAEYIDMTCARTAGGALHIWLRMPPRCPPKAFAEATRQRGVLLRPADLFAIDATARCDSVRISVTGPTTRDELRAGLSIVQATLAEIHGD
jgi:DNA-binding transcriptional MocR family regulator